MSVYGVVPNHSECGGRCGAAKDAEKPNGPACRCVASGVGASTGYSGGTRGDGACSTDCSPAGSVDGIEAVSVPIGVAMLIRCGNEGVLGSRGALYQAGSTGIAGSWADVAADEVSSPNRSPNGLAGAKDTWVAMPPKPVLVVPDLPVVLFWGH